MSMWNQVIKQAAKELPPFSKYTLDTYKEEQIDKCTKYMENCFREATRLLGNVELVGVRVLNPQERLENVFKLSKYADKATCDVTTTELKMVEFTFTAWRETHRVVMLLPYLVDGAICFNGARYYPIIPLTDSVFYHISKEHGIGIKVLTTHLRFYKNKFNVYDYTSMNGNRYLDRIIVTQLHRKSIKYLSEDIKPCILIPLLAKFGFDETLKLFGLDRTHIDFTNEYVLNDEKYEYFHVKDEDANKVSVYMKVDKNIIGTPPRAEILTLMSVVSHIHYSLQYFRKVRKTTYTDNKVLVNELSNSLTPWQIILGKMIYGTQHPQEFQVLDHAKAHLESLDIALDAATKIKLQEIDVYCEDTYELLVYVFMNMDSYLVNYIPSNLYNKRFNILDLLLGNATKGVFQKIYKKTNNRKNGKIIEDNIKDISGLFRTVTRAIFRIHECSQVVAGNPAAYNDNRLLAVGMRKQRATHSPSNRGTGGSKQSSSLVNNPQHMMHTSWAVVESLADTSTENPGIAGSINTFLEVDKTGKIIKPKYADRLEELGKVLLTK